MGQYLAIKTYSFVKNGSKAFKSRRERCVWTLFSKSYSSNGFIMLWMLVSCNIELGGSIVSPNTHWRIYRWAHIIVLYVPSSHCSFVLISSHPFICSLHNTGTATVMATALTDYAHWWQSCAQLNQLPRAPAAQGRDPAVACHDFQTGVLSECLEGSIAVCSSAPIIFIFITNANQTFHCHPQASID